MKLKFFLCFFFEPVQNNGGLFLILARERQKNLTKIQRMHRKITSRSERGTKIGTHDVLSALSA